MEYPIDPSSALPAIYSVEGSVFAQNVPSIIHSINCSPCLDSYCTSIIAGYEVTRSPRNRPFVLFRTHALQTNLPIYSGIWCDYILEPNILCSLTPTNCLPYFFQFQLLAQNNNQSLTPIPNQLNCANKASSQRLIVQIISHLSFQLIQRDQVRVVRPIYMHTRTHKHTKKGNQERMLLAKCAFNFRYNVWGFRSDYHAINQIELRTECRI